MTKIAIYRAVEVMACMKNYIPQNTMGVVITYSCPDLNSRMLVKGSPDRCGPIFVTMCLIPNSKPSAEQPAWASIRLFT